MVTWAPKKTTKTYTKSQYEIKANLTLLNIVRYIIIDSSRYNTILLYHTFSQFQTPEQNSLQKKTKTCEMFAEKYYYISVFHRIEKKKKKQTNKQTNKRVKCLRKEQKGGTIFIPSIFFPKISQ